MGNLQQQVQDFADGMVASGAEDGLQICVYHRGDPVVDVVAGLADTRRGRPVTPGTLFYSASTGKAMASTVAHVLVADGVLDYHTPVAALWPEFAASGKGGVTLRHVLTHSAGVPAVARDTRVEDLLDWDGMCARIAAAEPWWAPGERVGYHAVTFGYLIGEIVRRATGQPISAVLADRVAGPLGVADELFFGVPARRLEAVAVQSDDPVGSAAFASLPADFPLFKAVPPAIVPDAAYANRADVIAADLPYQGIVSARALARMYGALVGEVDGVRLLSEAHLKDVATLATGGLDDEMTAGTSTWALGFCVGWPGTSEPDVHPAMFGMVGIGGSAAFADRDREIAVAVTKNRFNPVQMDVVQRVTELVDAAWV